MTTRKKHLIIGSAAATIAAALVLVGCVAVVPKALHELSARAGVVSGAPATPEAESTVPPKPKPGFVDTSPGAPRVKRANEKPVGDRIGAPTATFAAPAAYANGITVAAAKFSRGTVTSRGTGIITGAPFLVFELTLHNGSARAVDVGQVVVTFKYGQQSVAAAPLYDDVTAADFTGSVSPGQSQTATYAFQLPKNVTSADLYVDLNGTLLPAHFDGTIPNG